MTATSSLRLRASQVTRQCRLQSALLLMATPPSLRSEVSANARASFHQHTRSANKLCRHPCCSLLQAVVALSLTAACTRTTSSQPLIAIAIGVVRWLGFATTHTHDERLTARWSARLAVASAYSATKIEWLEMPTLRAMGAAQQLTEPLVS